MSVLHISIHSQNTGGVHALVRRGFSAAGSRGADRLMRLLLLIALADYDIDPLSFSRRMSVHRRSWVEVIAM